MQKNVIFSSLYFFFSTIINVLTLVVKEASQHCIGGQELVLLRKKIHGRLEETNDNLKKNVYQNYMQFIDTAKEISRIL